MIPEIEYYKLASKDLKKLREMIYEMEKTKSQNTKNEQQKDLCITSEQLTEQYKHGNLPDDRLYYYRFKGELEVQITTQYGLYCEEADNKKEIEVIDFVPSYEELQNMNKAVNECMAANIKLVEQNAQLKELLKEVKDYLPEFETPMNILAKIDEALNDNRTLQL